MCLYLDLHFVIQWNPDFSNLQEYCFEKSGVQNIGLSYRDV